MSDWGYNTKAHRSGVLGEEFCFRQFGIKEDDRYEIKSSSADHGSFVVQAWQLLESLSKQYVVVRYERDTKRISRGPNKGKRKFTETVEQAYKKKLKVAVIRGARIIEAVMHENLKLYCTARGGRVMEYGKWGIVWRIPYRVLPEEVFEETDEYILYADSWDPPGWDGDATAENIEGGLFCAGEAAEEDGDEDVPF